MVEIPKGEKMEIIYILTIIILAAAFMIFKKSEEKLNFIKWMIIFVVTLYGYNIVIGMVLGLLNITSHIWLLSIINLLVSFGLGFKAIKNKDMQKYFVRKKDIAGIIIAFIIFGVMLVKDLYIHNGDIAHWAIDSAVHYRAAKHYSENLKIFINVEDKTFFNFNVMQTGAYINDGIFMNIVYGLTGIDHCYLYQAFESISLFVSGLAFYALFIDKIKTIRGLILSFILFGLYMYGYPYNSWFYGFSYLSIGIFFVAALVPVVECLYSEEKINKIFTISLIGILAFGLIFSYCLFVPAIFAAICIYVFLKDFNEDGKKYLKFFKKNTLIITGMLLIITFVGIGYLFIPTFFIEGQTNLVDALKIDGAIYSEKFRNFIPYLPFALLYCVELVRKVMKRDITYFDVFAVCMMGFFALVYLGLFAGFVSLYYLFKLYYVIWIVVFGVTINLINEFIDKKIAKWIIPIYVIAWGSFVCIWVWIKAGHILGEEEKHALPNYVGMYYMENCEYRKLVDMTNSFKKEQIEIAKIAMENYKDMTADNTEFITSHIFERTWLTAYTEIDSDKMIYQQVIEDPNLYSLQGALENKDKKYVICVCSDEMAYTKEEIKMFRDSGKIDILFENEYGYALEIIR